MGRVVVIVEMIVRNIRDDRGVELRAGGPILVERMARDLEGGVRRIPRDHRRQPMGQRLGIGRRHVGGSRIDAVVILDRAEQPGPTARRLEDRADQPGDGRLAVGSGHGDQFQMPRRLARQRRAELGIRSSHVGDDALRNFDRRQGTLDQQAIGSALDGFVHKSGAVDVRAGDGGKQCLGGTFLAALDGVRDANVRTADEAGRRQQRAKAHGDPQGQGPQRHAEDLPGDGAVVHARSTASQGRRAHRCGGTKQPSAGLFW